MLFFTGWRNLLWALAGHWGVLFSISVAGTGQSIVAHVKTICTANGLSQIVPYSVFAGIYFLSVSMGLDCKAWWMLIAWCLLSPSASLQSNLPSKENCQGIFRACAESFATASALSLALAGPRAAVFPSPSLPGMVGSSPGQSPAGKCGLWLRGDRGPGDGHQLIAALTPFKWQALGCLGLEDVFFSKWKNCLEITVVQVLEEA